MEALERARGFVYRNARPLDLARWNCLFENGASAEAVRYLAAYQNADGGFGSALEPDCWNPNSTPMQTWAAARIVREIGLEDGKHPLTAGILEYLGAGSAFDGHRWCGLSTVPGNSDGPHAPWWAWAQEEETGYNPTASLIGFILKYADENSPLFARACGLAQEAWAYLESSFPLESMHEAACFVDLYEDIAARGIRGLLDPDKGRELLQRQIRASITAQTDRWGTEYVCKPSQFIRSKKSVFYAGNEEICRLECDFIRKTQNADGTWDVTWSWDGFPEQWAISKNWWKTDIILRNLAFLTAMEPD